MNIMSTSDLYELFLKYPHVCIDSRKATEDSIFFALKGDKQDGNQYASQALEKCPYAVVDDPMVVNSDRYILVDDALAKLQNLATYHRKRLGLPILAITGTNGKTTTKELTAAVLKKKYNVAYTQGNLNNHIGVPLTLLSMTKEHDFGVVEMGASHGGEIEKLCKIALPDFGIITNVGKAHIEGFGSYEGVKNAKAELYRYLHDNDGLAFVNYDDETLEDMEPPHNIFYYGTKIFTHCQGLVVSCDPFLTFKWVPSDDVIDDETDVIDNDLYTVHTQLFGEYNFNNAMAALSVGRKFGVSVADIKSAIENYIPTNNRSQITKTDKNTLLLDCYNANPSSMQVALRNFAKLIAENKVLMLGEMRELGESSAREHSAVLALVEELGFDDVYLVGKNFMGVNGYTDFHRFETVEDLISHLDKVKISQSTIMIKGSNGTHMIKIVEANVL